MSRQGTGWHCALSRTLGCVRIGPTAASFLGTWGQHNQIPPLRRAQNKFWGKDFSFHPGFRSGFCLQSAGRSAQLTSCLVLVLCGVEPARDVSTRSVVLTMTRVYLCSFLRALYNSAQMGTATWGFSEERLAPGASCRFGNSGCRHTEKSPGPAAQGFINGL